MNSAPPKVGSVLGQIDGAEPLHHSVVGPLGDLSRCDVVLFKLKQVKRVSDINGSRKVGGVYLIRGATSQTVWVIGVQTQDLDGPLDAEVMKDAPHLQRQQIFLQRRRNTFQNRKGKMMG